VPDADANLDRRGLFEIAAVAITVVAYFVCYEVLDARGVFMAAAVLGWGAYVARRIVREPRCLVDYGLSRRGLAPTAKAVAWLVGLGGLACGLVALAQGRLTGSRGLLLAALFYPLWGLVQQTLVQAMVVRNIERRLPRAAVIAGAAALFGAIHLPDVVLAPATAALGAAFTAIYLRWRNVWPLAVGHGLLGALFYVWVLDRDPWAEVFGL
jgi:hypothetical protein